LLFIFIYDLKYYLIPDKIILPAIVITLISDIILSYFSVGSYFSNWLFYSNNPNLSNFLLAATAAGGFFLIQFLISKGRWIGGGDIRLGILMGLMLGWPGILLALFFAYLIGAIIGLGLIAAGKKNWKSQVPFGPFLAGGTIICLLV
jgi:prepilin signal peptidase PulO-like enzyme (type II secretory pathway)